ncbi:hypothetical protein EGX81_09285 [Proteus vulgaris]|nr:hypothetical protein EGX81_09285 [Proteus vulgaris]
MITVRGWIDDSGIAASSQIYITPTAEWVFVTQNTTPLINYIISHRGLIQHIKYNGRQNGFIKRHPSININQTAHSPLRRIRRRYGYSNSKGEYLIEGVWFNLMLDGAVLMGY